MPNIGTDRIAIELNHASVGFLAFVWRVTHVPKDYSVLVGFPFVNCSCHSHSSLTWIASDTVPVIRLPMTLTLSIFIQLLDKLRTLLFLVEHDRLKITHLVNLL